MEAEFQSDEERQNSDGGGNIEFVRYEIDYHFCSSNIPNIGVASFSPVTSIHSIIVIDNNDNNITGLVGVSIIQQCVG